MILYKNVDICDLDSIFKKGILSMDECGNDNWDEGKRDDNDTSVVYLFDPIDEINTFPKSYGAALLEVDCDASETEISQKDAHQKHYKEYITKEVLPNQIKRVIIPRIFKKRIEDELSKKIQIRWCEIEAEYYNEKDKRVKCKDEVLRQFAKTAPIKDTGYFNYFRGTTEKNTIIDLYNIKYIF